MTLKNMVNVRVDLGRTRCWECGEDDDGLVGCLPCNAVAAIARKVTDVELLRAMGCTAEPMHVPMEDVDGFKKWLASSPAYRSPHDRQVYQATKEFMRRYASNSFGPLMPDTPEHLEALKKTLTEDPFK